MIVDDVLTAGTAMRETFVKLKPLGVRILGAVVAVDRQEKGHEKGQGSQTALEEIAGDTGIIVAPIITITDAVAHLLGTGHLSEAEAQRIRIHLAQAAA